MFDKLHFWLLLPFLFGKKGNKEKRPKKIKGEMRRKKEILCFLCIFLTRIPRTSDAIAEWSKRWCFLILPCLFAAFVLSFVNFDTVDPRPNIPEKRRRALNCCMSAVVVHVSNCGSYFSVHWDDIPSSCLNIQSFLWLGVVSSRGFDDQLFPLKICLLEKFVSIGVVELFKTLSPLQERPTIPWVP